MATIHNWQRKLEVLPRLNNSRASIFECSRASYRSTFPLSDSFVRTLHAEFCPYPCLPPEFVGLIRKNRLWLDCHLSLVHLSLQYWVPQPVDQMGASPRTRVVVLF